MPCRLHRGAGLQAQYFKVPSTAGEYPAVTVKYEHQLFSVVKRLALYNKMCNNKLIFITLSFNKALHQHISYETDDYDLAVPFWNLLIIINYFVELSLPHHAVEERSWSGTGKYGLHLPCILRTEMSFILYTSEDTRNAQEGETGSNSASRCQDSFGTPIAQEDGKDRYTSVYNWTLSTESSSCRGIQPLIPQKRHSLATPWYPCTIKNGNSCV